MGDSKGVWVDLRSTTDAKRVFKVGVANPTFDLGGLVDADLDTPLHRTVREDRRRVEDTPGAGPVPSQGGACAPS